MTCGGTIGIGWPRVSRGQLVIMTGTYDTKCGGLREIVSCVDCGHSFARVRECARSVVDFSAVDSLLEVIA